MTEKQFGEFNQKRFITSVELDNSCGIEDLLKNEKYNNFREKDYHKLTKIRDELNELYYENEQLKSENKNLKSNVDDLMNMELEDRDIVCQAGKFRLEEWGKHRLHQFYDGDTPLEDETVVIRLMDLTTENEELKQQLSDINGQLVMLDNCDNWDYDRMKHTVREIAEIIGYNGTINPKR